MKLTYDRSIRVELAGNPTPAEIIDAISMMRAKAEMEFGPGYTEKVAILGVYPMAPPNSYPVIMFSAYPREEPK